MQHYSITVIDSLIFVPEKISKQELTVLNSFAIAKWVIEYSSSSRDTVGVKAHSNNSTQLPFLPYGQSNSAEHSQGPVYLASFSVRTLKQAGQQIALALTLKLIDIYVCTTARQRCQTVKLCCG
ncbi:hypothetical protein T265_05916 [Opisthorchis viverrini]|uniref:Uncharacterized protein n=1 Tax=Opisthorchis viverrini TaxID=6198 RepID=A0A074ZU60_OPIVI|nr:hypothetical protein T265_05916 [Opisthorchis viverrini]KER26935.1 hypothetical protein T265_05916 [Opisthorchis viverrini]